MCPGTLNDFAYELVDVLVHCTHGRIQALETRTMAQGIATMLRLVDAL
jgi:hypothetical protein